MKLFLKISFTNLISCLCVYVCDSQLTSQPGDGGDRHSDHKGAASVSVVSPGNKIKTSKMKNIFKSKVLQ